MNRYAFRIAYNGRDFSGWQRQPNAPSVQQCIEENLAKLFAPNGPNILGCGRTDAGVHASDFTFHVDLEERYELDKLRFKLNRMLPDSISVFEIKEVASDFHARFDATWRTYRYFVHTQKDPFAYDSLYLPQQVNFKQMQEATQYLLGKKDFTSLSKLHTDVKTNICEVTHAEWTQIDGTHWYFEITANRFLRNMVRATVGTLLEVGYGNIAPQDVQNILKAMDRGAAGKSVAGEGLFLWKVDY